MSPRSFSTIFSGRDFPAVLQDGTKLNVFVRQLPARHHIEFISIMGDEAKMLEFTCKHAVGEPELGEGWVDALSDASHEELVKIAKELNFSRAIATADRGNEVARLLMPHIPGNATSTT